MQPEEILKMFVRTMKDTGRLKTQEEEEAFRERFWSITFPSTSENKETPEE